MKSALNWFEIPVVDLGRAVKFYETVLKTQLRHEEMGPMKLAILKTEERGVGGALLFDGKRKPNPNGTLVYLNTDGQLDAVLGRVAAAGGSVVMPKTDIGAPGFIALIQDTEGNQVGLHQERA